MATLMATLAITALPVDGHSPLSQGECDAAMVARYAPTMPKDAYLEVVDFVLGIGAIDEAYAIKLRALIDEAYEQMRAGTMNEWAQRECGA